MTLFRRELAEAAGWNWGAVQQLNDAVTRLRERKTRQVSRWEGTHENPKTVWKIKVYTQTMLYRVISLADGCSTLANFDNILCAAVVSRSLFESVVVTYDFSKTLSRLLRSSDLSEIDSFVTDRIFGTRVAIPGRDQLLPNAVNILTLVDKMDRDFPGTRFHYDLASKFCHPNYFGRDFAFGHHKMEIYRCILSEENNNFRHIVSHMLTGFNSIVIFEYALCSIDHALPRIESLYTNTNPS